MFGLMGSEKGGKELEREVCQPKWLERKMGRKKEEWRCHPFNKLSSLVSLRLLG